MRIFSVFLAISIFLCPPLWAAEVVPAPVYLPVLPSDASSEAAPQLVPLAVNRSLEGMHLDVTRAIVVIHDETRDAASALATISTLGGAQNPSTIIVAPQFLLPSDIIRFASFLPEKGRGFATWPVLGWTFGDDSSSLSGKKGVSSFSVIDLLLMILSDRTAFPDLKEIIIVGHGVGANFVQRYAAFAAAAGPLARQDVGLRYVVASPTSFLYLTGSRPLVGKKGFAPLDGASCLGGNVYPYGMEKLNAYARRTGPNAAKLGYGARWITYLYNPDAKRFSDEGCAAKVQGLTAGARVDNYERYLQSIYGDVAKRMQTFFKVETGDDPISLFGSSCGMSVLFGDGFCPAPPVEIE